MQREEVWNMTVSFLQNKPGDLCEYRRKKLEERFNKVFSDKDFPIGKIVILGFSELEKNIFRNVEGIMVFYTAVKKVVAYKYRDDSNYKIAMTAE